MKNKSYSHGLSCFFAQRIHFKDSDNILELIRPQLERTKIELENIPRWEDEGGLIINEVAELAVMLNSNHLALMNELHT